MKHYVLTPAAGKRLIGKAVAVHPAVRSALETGTVVIVAGTTNGYVAEEVLASIGAGQGFSRARFFRGVSLPPSASASGAPAEPFPGDVVLVKGAWEKGKTIFDVVDGLGDGDVILKGANAVDWPAGRAAVLIGDPRGGTAAAAMQAVVGRRVKLIVPVGLEKRVVGEVDDLAARVNAPGSSGPRLLPLIGEIVTEIEAIELLTGASAELMAAGGVGGAEGCVWLSVDGSAEQMQAAEALMTAVVSEPAFEV
jgi:hypothetical protein